MPLLQLQPNPRHIKSTQLQQHNIVEHKLNPQTNKISLQTSDSSPLITMMSAQFIGNGGGFVINEGIE